MYHYGCQCAPSGKLVRCKVHECYPCRQDTREPMTSLWNACRTCLSRCATAHIIWYCVRVLSSLGPCWRQLAELTDACEALTLDKEQLALEKEDLQASGWLAWAWNCSMFRFSHRVQRSPLVGALVCSAMRYPSGSCLWGRVDTCCDF